MPPKGIDPDVLEYVDPKFTAIDTKLDTILTELSGLKTDIVALHNRVTTLEAVSPGSGTPGTPLEEQVSNNAALLIDHENRVTILESGVIIDPPVVTDPPATDPPSDFDLMGAVAASSHGDLINVPAGTYIVGQMFIGHNLNIVGDGTVTLKPSGPLSKGFFATSRGADVYFENIVFMDARNSDNNGAGIRHQGHNLIAVNCGFVRCQDGILSANDDGSQTGFNRLVNCVFDGCGWSDGRAHGMYFNECDELVLENVIVKNTDTGHDVKSLAKVTRITGSSLGLGSLNSYNIDCSWGGDLIVVDTDLIQISYPAGNHTMVNYDTSRGGPEGNVSFTGGSINNDQDPGTFFRTPTSVVAQLSGVTINNNANSWTLGPVNQS